MKMATLSFLCSVLVLQAAESSWQPAHGPLATKWATKVSATKPLPEYPRPQFVRKEWMNLNGLWDYAITAKDAKPHTFDGQILVPYPIESALSGVMKKVDENQRIWYRRTFVVPKDWDGKRIVLNFGAVDFQADVLVNGQKVGEHSGGYDGFSIDITQSVKPRIENEIVVAVWDPTDASTQPRGKQIRNPHGIWYTPTSGIWQTVWMEPVSAAYIKEVNIVPDVDNGSVTIRPITTARLGQSMVEASLRENGSEIYTATVSAGGTMTLPVKNAKLWSPEHPFLYTVVLKLKLGDNTVDKVETYFGMRKISLGKDRKGFTRLMLNNQPYFQL